MGVPFFFSWLIKNYKNNTIINNKLEIEIDYLLIDTNCLIHPVCFKILDENPDLIDIEKLENKMINAVIEYLEYLINSINPKIGVYIAIDGVPPLAKVKQQRLRRFKSISDKKLFDNIKKKYNIPIKNYWNNSAISPGTKFMENLHNKILEYINNKKNINIIYSSCYSPSEGEHKLLQYIKNNLNYHYIIYGLDADLIFLSLASQSTKIYLLREKTVLENKSDNLSKPELIFVNIEIMKECIYKTILRDNEILIDKKNIINDFIFICYFLGNDFLPHFISIDINNNGLDYLLNTYSNLLKTLNEYLILENYNIN
jgi:5'-3' exonuclease